MDHGGCKVQEIWPLISLALPADNAREQMLGLYNTEFDLVNRISEWCVDHGGWQVQKIRLLLSLALPAESAMEHILGL
jgi:hypothetical protein